VAGGAILLTFDDNIKSVWVNADPILERYHFRGVEFTITGRVGKHQPYYMNWGEIERMARSGRWDFESHTRYGHRRVDTGGPFLTNLTFLRGQRRLETLAEYEHRVSHDLDGSIEDLEKHGLPRPTLFAFPFGKLVSDER
jgi:biofilm PGA synthesis lipoprotein PgaB